jgi:parallel beta-helix repeat protein
MRRIEMKSERRQVRVADARRGRRLRPTVLALEGRTLLSTLTVNNTNDSGDGSLRAAMAQANADGGGDTIVFSDLFDTPQTITLTGGPIELYASPGDSVSVTIDGPGANLLSVSGNKASRVFEVVGQVTASFSGLKITGGSAASGGGLSDLFGSVSLTNCTISGNSASNKGGGLYVGASFPRGSLSLTNCTVHGNSAANGGGLYDVYGPTTLTNCTVSGNSAGAGGGGLFNGGGVNSGGMMTLTNCTVTGNSANTGGGFKNYLGTLMLIDSTVSNNSASQGGGLLNRWGTIAATNCTVSGNAAGNSGGLYIAYTENPDPMVTLTNTILAGNRGGDISRGPYTGDNDLIGGNPLLAPLGDYGGPTQTMALLPGSPAIGGGDSTLAPATDQRGLPRFGPTDIGAFEYQFKVTNNNDSGSGSLRQAIANANSTPGANTVVFLPTVTGTITLTSGQLELSNMTGTETITSPAAGVTISGNKASRVFQIDSGVTANLSGLTVGGGQAGVGRGGGLYNHGGRLTLTGVTVSGNTAGAGGGLATEGAGSTTTLTGCTVSRNTASYSAGGGLASLSGGTTALTDCTVSGNVAGADSLYGIGGGLATEGAGSTATLTGCTVSGNTASNSGGGLYTMGGHTTLTGCTVSGNTAAYPGGGLVVRGGGTLALTNVTVTNNTASTAGGGLYVGGRGTLALTNATVTGNRAGSGGGLYVNPVATATLTNTIVAAQAAGGDIAGGYTGSHNLVGGDPLLAPLGDYGGPTQTMALLPGSPAIGGGTADGAPTKDQRGQPRSGHVDIGAFQSQGFTLTPAVGSTPQPAAVGKAFKNPLAVMVTANNPVEPVDGGVIRFAAPPTGASASLSAATATITGSQASVTAIAGTIAGSYSVTAAAAGVTTPARFKLTNTPGAASSIAVVSGSGQAARVSTGFAHPLVAVVEDAYGNPVPGVSVAFTAPASGASATLIGSPATTGADGQARVTATAGTVAGSYTVTASVANVTTAAGFTLTNTEPASLVVDTVLDTTDSTDGKTSLREAIAHAEDLPGPHTITFDPAVFGTTPQTITLTNGPLSLTDTATITIAGPGAMLLTVSGNDASQVFDIEGGSVAISGLTVSGGENPAAVDGGGLENDGGSLTLTDCTVSDNAATVGGGLFTVAGGTTTLTDCTVSGNFAGKGAGLYNSNPFSTGSTTTLTNCTVTGNTAGSNGGGLYNNVGGTLRLTNCTVSGNTAQNRGGGLYNDGGAVTLTNTIVAARNGGGDVLGAVDPGSANNLIGIATGMTGIENGSNGNQVGTGPAPIDPLLAVLGDYGGPTQTMALLPGSPAIGGGKSGSGVLRTDQRGQPRAGRVDIGAFESQGFSLSPVPGSTPQAAEVGTEFKNPLAVTVTANNPVEPVDGGVIRFAATPAPGGASAILSAATATIQSGQAAVTATANDTVGGYPVTATAAGSSSASFSLTNTQTLASPGPTTTAAVLQDVDSLASLRAAIAYANSHPGPDTITFDPAVFGRRRRTIRLSGGPLILTDPATTTIIGPGAGRLTISGGGKSRVFDIQDGSLALSGVTITGGNADLGGGLGNEGGRLVLTNVQIQGNRAIVGGGLFNDGRTTLSRVLIKGNRAHVGPGLFNTRGATLLWRRPPTAGRAAARFDHTERK